MSKRTSPSCLWRQATLAALLGLGALAIPSHAQNALNTAHPSSDEFFIISSVDAPKKQLVLKFPTKVTELVSINEKTVFQDEQGKRLSFRDLRAGDTVFVTTVRMSDDSLLATRIRRGPMTLTELRRRYLKTLSANE